MVRLYSHAMNMVYGQNATFVGKNEKSYSRKRRVKASSHYYENAIVHL